MTQDGATYSVEDVAACERFIWSHDPDGLAAHAPCDPRTWAGSVKRELDVVGLHPELWTQPGASPAYTRCAAVMMIKNEADIISINLNWLYHSGVRRFVIMDNGSQDGTWAKVQQFRAERPEVELLAVNDPIVRHIQAGKTSGLCHLARNVWPDVDWIFPLDADEFLVARFGLRALVYVPDEIDALTVPKVVHFRLRGGPPDTAVARLPTAGMTVRSLPFLVPPKVILRARADLDVTQGNHSVRGVWGPVVYAGALQYGFFQREFQTRSFAQFLSKVRQGGAAILAARKAGIDPGGDHWLAWYETLVAGGEDALREEYDTVAFRDLNARYVVDPFAWTG